MKAGKRNLIIIVTAAVIILAAFVMWHSLQKPALIPETGNYACANALIQTGIIPTLTLSEEYFEITTIKGKVKCKYTTEHTMFSGDIVRLSATDEEGLLNKEFDGAEFEVMSPQILVSKGDYQSINKGNIFQMGLMID